MTTPAPKVASASTKDHAPLNSPDTPGVDASLINSGHGTHEHNRTGYYSDPVFGSNSTENPYGDTTEWDSTFRHMPLSEVIPRPWQSYHQIRIASYVSVLLFLLTGIFAVRFAHRGRMHQSKGLMGMAQRDLLLSVRLIYASVIFGIFLYFIIIPVAAN